MCEGRGRLWALGKPWDQPLVAFSLQLGAGVAPVYMPSNCEPSSSHTDALNY